MGAIGQGIAGGKEGGLLSARGQHKSLITNQIVN